MKFVATEYSKNSVGHYSPGVISGNMLYVSGQVAVDPATGKCPEGIEEQTKQALVNMERVLNAAGLTRNNVVMCHIYITDFGYWGDVNRIYAEFFGEHRPARVIAPVGDMKNMLIEIEAMAEVDDLSGRPGQ